mmetsp:Transcript_19623/g.35000  ORF Transcript_19623/g.35000 Transcript_19623/m.35000 type:complete len:231 (+) Transcript_19623:596-1288(+)
MKPFLSSFTPALPSPRPSSFGTRPAAAITTSALRTLPEVRVASRLPSSFFTILVICCFCSILTPDLVISFMRNSRHWPSNPRRIISPRMTRVTSLPYPSKIPANSTPMYPAPMMMTFFGRFLRKKTSLLVMRCSQPSIFSCRGQPPTHIRILSAVTFLSCSWMVCASIKLAFDLKISTPAFFKTCVSYIPFNLVISLSLFWMSVFHAGSGALHSQPKPPASWNPRPNSEP